MIVNSAPALSSICPLAAALPTRRFSGPADPAVRRSPSRGDRPRSVRSATSSRGPRDCHAKNSDARRSSPRRSARQCARASTTRGRVCRRSLLGAFRGRSRAFKRLAENRGLRLLPSADASDDQRGCLCLPHLRGCWMHRRSGAARSHGPGHSSDGDPHRGHSLSVVPLQLHAKQVRSGLRAPARQWSVRRDREDRDAGEADPQGLRALDLARLRRRLGRRPDLQRVQRRARDSRAVARGPRR